MQSSADASERSELLQRLGALWEQGHLCDLILRSRDGGKDFAVHRVVLSAVSESLGEPNKGTVEQGRAEYENTNFKM